MKDISLYGHLTIDTLLKEGEKEKKTLGSMANVWKALVELDCSLKIGLSPIDVGQALIYIDYLFGNFKSFFDKATSQPRHGDKNIWFHAE